MAALSGDAHAVGVRCGSDAARGGQGAAGPFSRYLGGRRSKAAGTGAAGSADANAHRTADADARRTADTVRRKKGRIHSLWRGMGGAGRWQPDRRQTAKRARPRARRQRTGDGVPADDGCRRGEGPDRGAARARDVPAGQDGLSGRRLAL